MMFCGNGYKSCMINTWIKIEVIISSTITNLVIVGITTSKHDRHEVS